MTKLTLDHIVISAERLEDGVAWLEDTLGVTMAPGGKHPAMGTHNRLLGLGDTYLEVIAIDPDAPDPGRARWFALDSFQGPPRLTNWVARTTDLTAALAQAPQGSGQPMPLSRGDLTWTIAISEDGTLPFDGGFPGLIDWGTTAHPSTRLPDAGCRLTGLTIEHPDADALKQALQNGPDATVTHGPALRFQAEITTPHGPRTLT